MRFVFDGKELVPASAVPLPPDPSEMFIEWVKEGARTVLEQAFEGAVVLLKGMTVIIPDTLGYATVFAAVWVIVNSMTGKGVMKPIAYYAALLIIGISVLGAV